MNKVKIISIFIGIIVLSVSVASMVRAVELIGEIDVEVEGLIGVTTPKIDIDNESVIFEVEVEGTGDNITYHVNNTLSINLDIVDNTNRDNFLVQRSVFYSIIMSRKRGDVRLLPKDKYEGMDGFFKRLFPVVEFNSVNIVDGINIERNNSITIELDYHISNTTFDNGEELTMHIYIIGFLPGDTNGITDYLPIIDHKTVTLTIIYI